MKVGFINKVHTFWAEIVVNLSKVKNSVLHQREKVLYLSPWKLIFTLFNTIVIFYKIPSRCRTLGCGQILKYLESLNKRNYVTTPLSTHRHTQAHTYFKSSVLHRFPSLSQAWCCMLVIQGLSKKRQEKRELGQLCNESRSGWKPPTHKTNKPQTKTKWNKHPQQNKQTK